MRSIHMPLMILGIANKNLHTGIFPLKLVNPTWSAYIYAKLVSKVCLHDSCLFGWNIGVDWNVGTVWHLSQDLKMLKFLNREQKWQ